MKRDFKTMLRVVYQYVVLPYIALLAIAGYAAIQRYTTITLVDIFPTAVSLGITVAILKKIYKEIIKIIKEWRQENGN